MIEGNSLAIGSRELGYCEIVGMSGFSNAPYIGLEPRHDGWNNCKEPVNGEIVLKVNSQAMPRT